MPFKLIFKFLLALFFVFLITSCNYKYQLKLMVPNEDVVALKEIANEISSHSRFEIEVITQDSLTEVKAIDQLLVDQFDN